MRLSEAHISAIRSVGFYVTEGCDGCGKILNQSFQYSDGHGQRFCSDSCFTKATGIERYRRPPAQRRTCEGCGKPFRSVRSNARFCSQRCQKRHARAA